MTNVASFAALVFYYHLCGLAVRAVFAAALFSRGLANYIGYFPTPCWRRIVWLVRLLLNRRVENGKWVYRYA
jgi:hypothetical protein